MKTEPIRTCSNCHHFAAGVCSAPVPASCIGIHFRRSVKPTSGANCDAHRMRAVRQAKLKLVGEAA